MPEIKRITIKDKDIFKKYYNNIDASIYNFTNLFMWSGEDSIVYFEEDGFIVPVFQFGKTPPTVLFPVGEGDFRLCVLKVCDYLSSRGVNPVFSQLTNDMMAKMKEYFPTEFEFVPNRNAADYVYEVEKMITHSGKKLHSKKNHLNYFLKNYNFEYRTLSENDMDECKALFDMWQAQKEEDLKLIAESKEATYKVLDNFKELGVKGGGIWLDDKLIAFSIGEQITENMALIHLEVADSSYRGAFNAINQKFCENEWKDLKYVNREEDMGIEGLRKAKTAYNPVFLIDRYNAVFKG